MKCPACGKWNRASFPVCFSCGEPLPQEQSAPGRKVAQAPEEQEPKVVLAYDEFGEERQLIDRKDQLARQMRDLHERKRRGEERQEELRRQAAHQGFAPTGTSVVGHSRRSRVFSQGGQVRANYPGAMEPQVDYDGYTQEPQYTYATDELSALPQQARGRGGTHIPLPRKSLRRARLFGLRRALPLMAVVLLALGGLFAAWQFIYLPMTQARETPPEEGVQVNASILNDMAAHTVRIPAPEGSQIYIKELRRFFLVTGGYATFQVEDHVFYDQMETQLPSEMEVTLSPYIRTGDGEQVAMDPVTYTIQIPLSPLTLIKPDITYTQVSTPIYNIQFHVMANSNVYINGEDYSSYVNTQNGLISYNAAIQPIGENKIHILVRSPYYRENETTLTIFRAVQDIPLDLASTLEDRSSKPSMTITATTRAGATVTILSPYHNLDTSQLASTGFFKFDAVFNRIGTNTIIIQAEYPDKQPTVVEYDVYHLPDPDTYTPKAWPLDAAYGYADLLANLATRIRNTQIYVFTGPVMEIVSSKPQLVIFDCADGQGVPLKVMVENQSRTEWKLGQRYRIFGDVFGTYGGIPRLIARYTYPPRN